jgi:serine/threonine protein kinase
MLLGSLTSASSFIRPWQVGQASTSTAKVRASGHDGRADVYSLGVTLYRMLGGVVPFEAPSSSEWLATLARFSTAPLRSLNADVPPDLADTVMRAMAKEPANRPTTRELESSLQSILQRM